MKKEILLILCALTIGVSKAQNLGLKWAEKVASVNDLYLNDIESDASGNYYVTGRFSYPTDFDPGTGINNLFSAGLDDIFIAKYNSSGEYQWAQSYGDVDDELANAIAVNAAGESVVLYEYGNLAGSFFLLRHDANGNLLNYFQGTGSIHYNDNSNQIAIDDQGNVVLMLDNILVMFDSAFNIVWEKGLDIINAESIAFDQLGDIYAVCQVSSSGFFFPNESAGGYAAIGNFDLFVSKISSSGNLIWSGTVGGPNTEGEARIETDGTNRLFLTYQTTGLVETQINTQGAYNNWLGGGDVILSSYDLDGNQLWTNTIGGTSTESPSALTYSASTQEIYISTIIYPSYDGDPSSNVTTNSGPIYSYLASTGQISSWGQNFLYDGSFRAPQLEALSSGGVVASERFISFGAGTDVAPGNYQSLLYANGAYNIYMAKYGYCQSNSYTMDVTVCVGATYNYNAQDLSAGSYQYTYMNAAGCDSLFTLNVNEWPTKYIDTVVGVCGNSLQFYDTLIVDAGDYTLNYYNSNGCLDSVVTLSVYLTGNLNVTYANTAGIHYFSSNSMPFNGLVSVINCDNSQVVQQNPSSWISYNTMQPASAYQFTYAPTDIPSIGLFFNGCVVETNCINTVTAIMTLQCPANQTITPAQSTTIPNITAQAATSTTCPSGMFNVTQSPSAGQPLQNGNNQITITAVDNCGNAQTCITVINYVANASVSENIMETNIAVYPNPANDELMIDLSSISEESVVVELRDLSGKLIMRAANDNGSIVRFNLSNVAKGVYNIYVLGSEFKGIKRISKM